MENVTSTEIFQSKESLVRIQKGLDDKGIIFKVGDTLVGGSGGVWFYKVDKIIEEEEEEWVSEGFEERHPIKVSVINIYLRELKEMDDNTGVCTWEEDIKKYSLDDIIRYNFNCMLTKSIKEMQEEVIASLLKTEKKEVPEASTSTEIGFSLDKDQLENMEKVIKNKMNEIEARSRVLNFILGNKRRELEIIKEQMEVMIKKINRVITTIELFLGVKETLVQIRQGVAADMNYPISLRQQLLFMDEEVGIADNDGIDFTSIDKFDAWVADEKNMNVIIPENKGVVALRVRRKDKHYSDDVRTNAFFNEENHKTYFLIRNGDNLYRVWADLNVGERLFPLKDELQKIIDDRINSDFERDKELLDNTVFFYKRNFVVLQGIIERTNIFTPLPYRGINLFKAETYKEFIQFIYDDEAALSEGRLSYHEWKESLNNKIERGSRIYISSRLSYREHGSSDRFMRYYRDNDCPPMPSPGIYVVYEGFDMGKVTTTEVDWDATNSARQEEEEDKAQHNGKSFWFHNYDDKEKKLRFKRLDTKIPYLYVSYNPKDDVYAGWGSYETHVRKNNVTFKIFKYDSFIFNYDLTDLEDIQFYLNSRFDRRNYLEMIPTLKEVRDLRKKEQAQEDQFGELIVKEVMKLAQIDDASFPAVNKFLQESINWWKTKVIWKRPITEDDAKAWRMIKSRLITILKEIHMM